MYLALMLVIIYVCCLVFKKSRSKRPRHNIFLCQYICDDAYSITLAKNKEEIRIKDIARRREEYVEWINNCNRVFENNRNVSTDRKVCRRTIDGAA